MQSGVHPIKSNMAEVIDRTDFQNFCFLLEFALKYPSQQRSVKADISRMLTSRNLSAKYVKIAEEFYKNLYPKGWIVLWRELFTSGNVNGDSSGEPYVTSFLSKLLFVTVTSSSIGCAEYCANVWLERVQSFYWDSEEFSFDFPNPVDFLQVGDLSRQLVLTDIFTQLNEQSSEQRRAYIIECSDLIDCVPFQFYSRVALGLFVFLLYYKSEEKPGNEHCSTELEVWADTWMILVASSLQGKFNQPHNTLNSTLIVSHICPNRPCLHHLLCSLMISTNSFKLLNSFPAVKKKVLKGMEQLVSCSSGFTTAWLKKIKSFFEESKT